MSGSQGPARTEAATLASWLVFGPCCVLFQPQGCFLHGLQGHLLVFSAAALEEDQDQSSQAGTQRPSCPAAADACPGSDGAGRLLGKKPGPAARPAQPSPARRRQGPGQPCYPALLLVPKLERKEKVPKVVHSYMCVHKGVFSFLVA